MKYDIIFKNANLYYGNGELAEHKDMGIKDGYIEAVEDKLCEDEADQVIDVTGCMISPGFVDSHMHIDLNYTYDHELVTTSLIGGAKLFEPMFAHSFLETKQQIFDDITERSAKTIEECLVHGSTALKTNVTYFKSWEGIALDSMLYLKEKYKEVFDLYTACTFTMQDDDGTFDEKVVPLWEQAARDGKIDFVSGYPHKFPNGRVIIDSIFERAKEFQLPIDIHCDESDVPNLNCFSYVLDKIIETGMQGHVTCGHVTALSSKLLDEEIAKELVEKAARADVNITTLTSCNMFLMNMNRRGPTRVKELTDAGVKVSIASDDVREVLRPFGNCDLVEEALLTAQVHKMGTKKELRQIFDMISYNPARNTEIKNYGVKVGCKADLVVLAAPTPEDVILDQPEKPYVLKNGKIVARSGKLIRKVEI